MKRIAFMVYFFCFLGCFAVSAQDNYSYFYFEGDQQTPFYVKVEGKMQTRYGLNHFIIPDLAPGYTHFEILFQQNKYPPQKYYLEVPEKGFRGFSLKEINNQKFALYDLEQKKYILSDNTKEDGAAAIANYSNVTTANTHLTETKLSKDTKLPSFPKKEKEKKNKFLSGALPLFKGDSLRNLPENKPPQVLSTKQIVSDSSFIQGVVLNSDGVEDDSKISTEGQPVESSGCSNAMNNKTFESFALRFLDVDGDEGRLKYMKRQSERYCFSTEQVRIITKNLEGQSARYEMVKLLYPRTSDRENYAQLENLFNTPFLKEKFKEIILSH